MGKVLITGLLLLLLLLLLLTKIQIVFGYREKASYVRIRVWGILLKQKKKKKKNASSPKEQQSDGLLQQIKQFKSFYKKSKKYLKKALHRGSKRLRIERLEFLYVGGFEDAAVTALAYGTVSGIVYDIYAMLQHFIGVEQTKIQMLPEFHKQGVTVETEWQLSFRVWHIFHMGCALLPLLFLKKES
ncbi:MAG: DUF2953 domain-containing protein [Ruminococcaceae bacterium]|nr:DUF2953 domain-containing protein [Oscillospiraceae bacterium]